MADEWSRLPPELVDLISNHLSSETDILRFRSVCASWRSAVTRQQSRFPILPNAGISETTWGFHLSKRTIFCIGLPQPHPQTPRRFKPWIIKLQRYAPQRMRLLNPLSGSEPLSLPDDFPKSLDSSSFRASELGHEFILQYINYPPFANSNGDHGTLYMEKVALSPDFECGFVILTIHVSGKLAVLRHGDRIWSIVDDLPSPYDDVIFYAGKFYAVDSTGRTVIVLVGSVPTVELVANPVFGGDKKFLVESLGELYLVDKYLSVGPEDDLGYAENFAFYEDFDCFMTERTVKFEVFKLDKIEEKWVKVNNLGDRMLLLGENCGFSASALDFRGCKGNCIIFCGQGGEEDGAVKSRGVGVFDLETGEEDGAVKSRGVGVFDLETGSIGPIANYPGYSELFWPPPAWISFCSNASEIEK